MHKAKESVQFVGKIKRKRIEYYLWNKICIYIYAFKNQTRDQRSD